MKTLSYTLCAVLAAGFAFTGDAQVKPKSKKVTELKFSGRIQGQWDGIESDGTTKEDRNHFYFRRLFLVVMPKWEIIGVALSIFVEYDEDQAKAIWTRDLEVDQLHKENNQFCQSLVEKDPTTSSSVFEVLFISKSLERVCDHAVNISKETVFMATSRDVRHAPEFKKSALRKELD
jgi:hypothetical protein